MDLSVIIVNWNSKDYLLKSVASIEAETKGIEFEIVVIDSGSFDGCEKILRKCHPQIHFIQSIRNVGFAIANNEAFKMSRGRNLLFLNPDTEIEGTAIEVLNHYLDVLPSAGIVGARLLNSDGSVQKTCTRSFPTVINQFLESEFLERWIPHSRLWGMTPLLKKTETPIGVDAVSGACLMIKRSVFERVGMFSTDYFMYSEDIDLCYKVRKAGLNTYYIPTAEVIHHGGASSSQSIVNTFSTVMKLESRWRFFKKTRSLWYSRLYRLAMFIASIIRIGVVIFMWPIYALSGRKSMIETVRKKWMARLRWALGGERWVKNY